MGANPPYATRKKEHVSYQFLRWQHLVTQASKQPKTLRLVSVWVLEFGTDCDTLVTGTIAFNPFEQI